ETELGYGAATFNAIRIAAFRYSAEDQVQERRWLRSVGLRCLCTPCLKPFLEPGTNSSAIHRRRELQDGGERRAEGGDDEQTRPARLTARWRPAGLEDRLSHRGHSHGSTRRLHHRTPERGGGEARPGGQYPVRPLHGAVSLPTSEWNNRELLGSLRSEHG